MTLHDSVGSALADADRRPRETASAKADPTKPEAPDRARQFIMLSQLPGASRLGSFYGCLYFITSRSKCLISVGQIFLSARIHRGNFAKRSAGRRGQPGRSGATGRGTPRPVLRAKTQVSEYRRPAGTPAYGSLLPPRCPAESLGKRDQPHTSVPGAESMRIDPRGRSAAIKCGSPGRCDFPLFPLHSTAWHFFRSRPMASFSRT